MTKKLPSPELLRKLLRYDPKTGKLFWRERTPDMFTTNYKTAEGICKRWNQRYSGKEALTGTMRAGYRAGGVLGNTYYAHRVIWAMQTGCWPQAGIDHIDGNPLNNRLQNLRPANQAQNMWNTGRKSNNTSGYKGVHWSTQHKKWTAKIRKKGKKYHLGLFICPKEAHDAYCKAAKEMHGVYANTGELT